MNQITLKKISGAILACLIAICGHAQSAHTNTVAASLIPGLGFRHAVPSAQSVAIRGSWSPDTMPLQRDAAGLWTSPAPALTPGAYEYSVLADGATNPVDLSAAFILHVPALNDSEYVAAGAAHGRVHVHRYVSHALGTNRECWVYTPPGYDAGDQRYPLLVLQHAGADTQKTWVAKGNVDWLLDQLIAAKRARPMVVLMLDGHPQGEPVYLKDETRVAAMNDLKRELFEDAIPLAEANYRIEPSRELRGLAGPSVGGGQMISIGLSNLDRFAWLGVFSAGHDIPEFYQAALDDPAALNARLKLLWISCARDDKAFAENEKFIALLKSKGIRYEWYITPGAHNWRVWRRDLTEYLSRVFQPTPAGSH